MTKNAIMRRRIFLGAAVGTLAAPIHCTPERKLSCRLSSGRSLAQEANLDAKAYRCAPCKYLLVPARLQK